MTCKNCGHPLDENFCSACGEKTFDAKQLSIKHFVEETFEGLVHFDNKYLRTVKLLLTKPGQLSLDYVEGRRVRHMKPIPCFLITNLIFFLFIVGNPYSQPLESYLSYTHYHAKEMVQKKTTRMGIPMSSYHYIFDERVKTESKELIFLFIPFYALVFFIFLIFYHRLFVEHLVFATHFVSFILVWFFIGSYLISLPFYLIEHINYSPVFDGITSILTSLVVAAYLAFASRRFYKCHWVLSIILGLAVGASFFYIIQFYRMALFYIIYLT